MEEPQMTPWILYLLLSGAIEELVNDFNFKEVI